MPTSYTGLIGLALPATGELSGAWGDTVNDYITQYLDAAVAGAQTISGSQTAVTLSTANGTTLVSAGSGSTGSAQYSIINCTGNPAGTLTVTVPTASKVYLVINATSTSQSVVVKPASNPGITVAAGRAALLAWNGSDFVRVATNDLAAMIGTISLTTGVTGTLPVANGGTGVTTSTGTGANVLSGSPVLTTPNLGTPTALTLTSATGLPLTTGTTGTLPVNKGGTGQTTYTNGELLIGNTTGNTLTKATLTAGTGITITNGTGSITLASSVSIPALGAQAFASSGTFTIPAGITSVKATIVGGGGGGGGAEATTIGCCVPQPAAGGSGGGGGSAFVYLSGLTPGNTITVTIGAGGSAGSATPGNGGAGGSSTISSGTQSITTVTGAGGGLGVGATGTAGASGAGGGTTNATWGISGQPGATSKGGDTFMGFGGGYYAVAGTVYGGGGAGALNENPGGGGTAGAAGAAGFVLFEY